MERIEVELHAFRHAESAGNMKSHIIGGRSDHFQLSPAGPAQATALGLQLLERSMFPDVVCSSVAIRAQETGKIVLQTMGLTNIHLDIVEGLHEVDQGEFTGRLREEIWTPELIKIATEQGKDFSAPGGESFNEAGLLAHATFDAYIARHVIPEDRPLRVFAFMHGLRIRCFASRLHDWTYDQTRSTSVPNVSDSLFVRQQGHWKLIQMGMSSPQPLETLL